MSHSGDSSRRTRWCWDWASRPDLDHHGGRHDERIVVVKGTGDDRPHAPVTSLEADEGASVEHRTGHRPRARSAVSCSAAVSGPPVAAQHLVEE